MSNRRYKFKVTSIDELQTAHPYAVDTTEIPARTEKKANYPAIAMLIDRGVIPPGIELEEGHEDTIPPILKACQVKD